MLHQLLQFAQAFDSFLLDLWGGEGRGGEGRGGEGRGGEGRGGEGRGQGRGEGEEKGRGRGGEGEEKGRGRGGEGEKGRGRGRGGEGEGKEREKRGEGRVREEDDPTDPIHFPLTLLLCFLEIECSLCVLRQPAEERRGGRRWSWRAGQDRREGEEGGGTREGSTHLFSLEVMLER